MRVRSFSHVAITIADFNRTMRFYADVSGEPVVGVSDTASERVRSFFAVDAPAPECKIGWIRVPGGATIFEFKPAEPGVDVVWNRCGITHLSFNVKDTRKWYDYLVAKGVEIVAPVEQLIDNKHMRHVLRWLGPLRRGDFPAHLVQGVLPPDARLATVSHQW